MKLKNKKTGKIEEFEDITRVFKFIGNQNTYNSLAELNEEWEDYEEPKEYWCIDWAGGVNHITLLDDSTDKYEKAKKEIGNYFGTPEEAELAVRKLKAWKRLKDKGFQFIEGYLDNNDDFIIKAKLGHVGLINQPDVSLLFGGKE